MTLRLDEIPALPEEGADKVQAGDAFWVPVSCHDHEGFVGDCPGCAFVWGATRESMVAAAAANLKAGL